MRRIVAGAVAFGSLVFAHGNAYAAWGCGASAGDSGSVQGAYGTSSGYVDQSEAADEALQQCANRNNGDSCTVTYCNDDGAPMAADEYNSEDGSSDDSYNSGDSYKGDGGSGGESDSESSDDSE
jgi:hypothetical protein